MRVFACASTSFSSSSSSSSASCSSILRTRMRSFSSSSSCSRAAEQHRVRSSSSSSSSSSLFLRPLPSSSSAARGVKFSAARRSASVGTTIVRASSSSPSSGEDKEEVKEPALQSGSEFDTLKELEKDMLKFQQQDLSNPEKQKQREKDSREKQGVDAFKEAIDQFLLYDFFVILFILAWLVFGVGVRLGVYKQGLSYDEPVLGTWLFLWPFLFQPLLGVHMLATLVSPLIGKLKEKGILGEDAWQ